MSLETLSNRNASLFFVSALDPIVVRRDQTYPFNKTTTAEGTIRPDNLWRLESAD
jgi:hypothetical protein